MLVKNNHAYRHVFRFFLNILMFSTLLGAGMLALNHHHYLLLVAYLPFYCYFQGLIIAGFMVHSHEMSHAHIKKTWLNDLIGIVSSAFCYFNYYSFREAHIYHHKNIGNIDEPEVGAPISKKGQRRLLNEDKLHQYAIKIYTKSTALWFIISWPLFIYYGDYNSWILPFKKNGKIHRGSLCVFTLFLLLNLAFMFFFPIAYLALYLPAVLIGGNRILIITSMHHAHEDTVFFNESLHHPFNVIMSSTDRNFGFITNFFMMNNGYHIPHHMQPKIAYYDLPKASKYLRQTIPAHLAYHYYPNSRFYHDFIHSFYEKRLDSDPEYYQLTYEV